MKAAVLFGNEDLRYVDYEEPELKAGTVKVRVHASGICGSDVPRVLYNGAHSYPIILGHEFSGEVVECGDGVTKVKPGNHVAGIPLIPCFECDDCKKGNYSLCKHYSFVGSRQNGSFADYVVLPEQNVLKIDSSIAYEKGALFEPSTVALHGLKQNHFEPGKNVAVIGAGTIGYFTMQWCRIKGAKKVVVFECNQERIEVVKKLGFEHIIDTSRDDYLKEAMELTDGKGYDFVFENVGAEITAHMAFELAANKARVCFIGTPTKDISFSKSMWENMNRKEFYLTGSWMSYSAPWPGEEWIETDRCFADGSLIYVEEMIYKKIPLSKAWDAFELYKSGKVNGKILLINDD